jgi:hypothetical protein
MERCASRNDNSIAPAVAIVLVTPAAVDIEVCNDSFRFPKIVYTPCKMHDVAKQTYRRGVSKRNAVLRLVLTILQTPTPWKSRRTGWWISCPIRPGMSSKNIAAGGSIRIASSNKNVKSKSRQSIGTRGPNILSLFGRHSDLVKCSIIAKPVAKTSNSVSVH